jgi:hypothetical protein
MRISKWIAGVTLIALSGCTTDMPSGDEWMAASDYLSDARWGKPTAQPASAATSSKKLAVFNEEHTAVAGVPEQVGVRWTIDKNCNPRPLNIKVVAQPRFGRVSVRQISHVIPAQSAISGHEATMRRCAGRPTVGHAVIYEAPEGHGNYYDLFSIETSGGLRYNYKVLVEKPVG